jgi:hypothetical protein
MPSRRACLVEGCACKDARIISLRRVAYITSRAIENGETANRIVAVEADWRLPADTDLEIDFWNGAPR